MSNEVCPEFKSEEPYEKTLGKAWEELRSQNPGQVVRCSAASFAGSVYSLKVFDRLCSVDISNNSILLAGKAPQPLAKIIILHYLARCPSITPTGKVVSYRDLPNGQIYFPAFKKKVIEPLAEIYQKNPQLMASAALKLGGKRLDLGSSSAQLRPLPKLPVTIIIWKADKDVHGSANMLFDETAARVLPPEDLAEVGWFVFSELRKASTIIEKEVLDRNEI